MPRPRKVENDEILVIIKRLVDENAEFSSEYLGAQVGLSRPTINRRLREMDEKNLIRVKHHRDNNGHRRYTVKVLAKGRKRLERLIPA